MRLEGKITESIDVVSRVPQGSVFGPLLFILYTSELFHIVGSHVVNYAYDITIYAVILRPLSRSQVIISWHMKWHMRINPKKMKSMVVIRSRTYAPGYDDLSFGGAEVEEVTSLCTLRITLTFKLTFETQ